MAKGRMIPTQLLWDPDFNDLTEQAQLVLLKLALIVDDHGRGRAHLSNLARQCNKDQETTEQSLQELEAKHLLLRYTVDGECYFLHCKWSEWQMSSFKPARPKYPAPPQESVENPGTPEKSLGVPESHQTLPLEDKLKEDKLKEDEDESEDENQQPSNVTPFPTSTRDDANDQFSIETTGPLATQVASILKIAITPALTRIVEEFSLDHTISLLGEADAAREWIDDPGRNKKRQLLTPAFFRRWLKRETEAVAQRAKTLAATGTTGGVDNSPPATSSGLARRSLMNLEKEYRAAAGKDRSCGS